MKLSVVSTLYKSESFLVDFIHYTRDAISELDISDYEIVLVVDGITDASKSIALNENKNHNDIVLIELSRNFGHHYAAHAGLANSQGDYIFIIDCDLEVHPNFLLQLFREIKDSKYDVVYGVQQIRKGGFVEKFFGSLFWKFFNLLSDVRIPESIVTERIMTRKYLNALLSLNEKSIFMAGLMYWIGFDQKAVPVVKKSRKGKSTYNFSKRLDLLIEAISSFSEKPLKILFNIGMLITVCSSLVIIYQVVNKIINPETVLLGFTSLFSLILLSLGVLTWGLGIIGIYLAKMFRETKSRPLYLIKNIYK